MKRGFIIFLLLLTLLSSLYAGEEKVFSLSKKVDIPIISIGTGLYLGYAFSDFSFPSYDGKTIKNNINPFDKVFAKGYSNTMDGLSNVFLTASFAFPIIVANTHEEQALEMGVMFAETAALTSLTVSILKNSVKRNRPYMYFPSKHSTGDDRMKSFPSGHTATAFMIASFSSYVHNSLSKDRTHNIIFTAEAFTAATIVGACRVGAGKHFVSDVLSGALIGSFFGVAVPKLHKLKAKSDNKLLSAVEVTPVSVSFTFVH